MKLKLRLQALLSILTLSLFTQAFAEEPSNPLNTLEKLVNGGQYSKAYAQAQDMLFDYEGNPEFDLLYGTAANETGHSDEAVFIFERLAAADPANPKVQFGLAKAYYKVGNKEEAKPIFERLLIQDESLSEQEQIQVASYLNAMSSGEDFDENAKGVFKGLVGLSVGYDDNVNTASDADTVEYYSPWFLSYSTVGNEKESSAYLAPRLSISYLMPLSAKTAIEFKGGASARKVKSDLEAYDNSATSFEIANPWRFDKGVARFSVRHTALQLDGSDLFGLSQFDASWKQAVDWSLADSMMLAFTTGTMRYDTDLQSSKDINLYALKLALSKQEGQLQHNVSFTLGADRTKGIVDYQYWNGVTTVSVSEEADENSRDYVILAYGLNYSFDAKTAYFGNLSLLSSSYEDVDHLHPNDSSATPPVWEKRDGNLLELTVGTRFNWSKELKLHAMATVRDASSDVDFYNYSKNTIEVGAAYQF